MERLLFDVTFHMGVKDDGGKLGVLDEALRKYPFLTNFSDVTLSRSGDVLCRGLRQLREEGEDRGRDED